MTDNDTQSENDGNGEIEGGSDTDSTATRHWLSNDLAAGWLLVSTSALIGLDAAGLIDLAGVPTELRVAYLIPSAGIAVAWLFGGGAVRAWSKVSGGK